MHQYNFHKEVDLKLIIEAIQDSLDDSLLKPSYRRVKGRNKFTGHCYAASEALYYLTGGKENWIPQVARDSRGGTHWWLKNKLSGDIVDLTQKQYTDFGEEPPHDKGCGRGFQQQSFRCIEIMRRVGGKLQLTLG